MPIDSTHPEYTSHIGLWAKCRDAVDGEEAVKAAGSAYLPTLTGQPPSEYAAYKLRACFYAAAGRTVDGLTGAIFRKHPKLSGPTNFVDDADLLAYITEDRKSLWALARMTVAELMTTGRVGLMVDADDEGRPYLTSYNAEAIVNWSPEIIDGRLQLGRVVLREEYAKYKDGDPYEATMDFRYRELMLLPVDDELKFIYVVRVWERHEERDESTGQIKGVWAPVSTHMPRAVGGRPLNYLPFVIVNPLGIGPDVEKPPLLDLVNVNLSHYRTSADLEHGRHFAALPTPCLAGFDTKLDYHIGSAKAWATDNPQAKWGFLEFQGQGLGSLEKAVEHKEKQMAVLGSRLLEERLPDAEAAAAIKLRQAGEQSMLASIADAASQGLTEVLRMFARCSRMEGETAISVQLNKDFDTAGIDSQLLINLIQMLHAGDMSFEAFYHNLQKGEVYPNDWTIEKERTAIQASHTQLPGPPEAYLEAEKPAPPAK
jgi:hypothetical protein